MPYKPLCVQTLYSLESLLSHKYYGAIVLAELYIFIPVCTEALFSMQSEIIAELLHVDRLGL